MGQTWDETGKEITTPGASSAQTWDEQGNPVGAGPDALTAKTQTTAAAAGVGKPAPVPLPGTGKHILGGTFPSPLAGGPEPQVLGTPIAPAGAATSLLRAGTGLAAGYAVNKLTANENPWVRDAATIGAGILGEGVGAAIEAPHPLVRGIARDVSGKYIGKTAADAILPPPPEAPPDMQADVAQQVAREKALKTAREQAGLRRPQADIDAENAQKAQDAAYNKEGQEQMAIQKRADDATAARVAAEKASKNAQFQAEQAHAKNLADYEKSRVAEITTQAKVKQIQDAMDAAEKAKEADTLKSLQGQMDQATKDANAAAAQKERLRTMHGNDLMQRGREQGALDKAAKDAAEEEDAAKSELTEKNQILKTTMPWEMNRPGSPTEGEQFLTLLNKTNIWTPEMERDAIRMWGNKARMQPGEGFVNYRARIQGYMYPGRAPRGMTDIEGIGPSTRRGLPPPPSSVQ